MISTSDLKELSEKVLSSDNYERPFRLAQANPVLVPELLTYDLRYDGRLLEKIQRDYVFASCLLFANKPTPYQVPFFRALENLQSSTVQWPRQSGKTQSFGVGANLVALTRKNSQVIVISASMRQSLILRRKMNKPLYSMHPALRNMLYKATLQTSITTKTGGLIAFESCLSEDQIRGYSADLIIGDEVEYWANAEYLYNDVLDPMFNTTDGAFVAGSTPKTKAGLFYKLCISADFEHLHADIHDAYNACILTSTRYEKILRRYKTGEISEATWQSEFLANFFDDEMRVLPFDKIIACVTTDPNYVYYKTIPVIQEGSPMIGGQFFTGTDLGKLGDHAVVTLIERVEPAYLCIRHVKVFDLGTSEDAVIDYHKQLAKVFTIYGGRVDGTNNSYWADKIARTIANNKVAKLSVPYKTETARIMSDVVRNKRVVLPLDMRRYCDALNSINRTTLDTDTAKEHSGKSDIFWSTGLSFRAATEHKHGYASTTQGR